MKTQFLFPLLASVFLTACGAEPLEAESVDDEAAVAQVSAPLLGGTATSLRPEIGRFSRGCTATLIAPRYVLTAAHCIGSADDLTNLAVMPNDAFVFVDRSGAERAYPVTKLYAVGKNRRDYVPEHDLNVDVMLLRLSAPVPSAQAVPAKLARTYPAAGTPATTFGFGCQDRDTQMGGGSKQFVTFAYGPHASNNNCPGDSGGPVVFGAAGDGGPIFAVNSGYYCFFGCHDDFGDAAWMANAVEALIRKLEGGLEEGMDRPGMDFTSFSTSNAAQCSSSCSGTYDFRCKAFTFVKTSWNSGTCYLKDALPDRTPIDLPYGVVSGVNVNKRRDFFERGTNRPGSDYTSFSAPDAEGCKTACARDSRCRSLTFSAGVCFLKNAVPSPTDAETTVVSAVRGGFEMEKNRGGSDFDNFDAPMPEDCQSRCAGDARCWSWTWTRPTSSASARCWLKSSTPALTDATDCISGVKNLEFFPGQ